MKIIVKPIAYTLGDDQYSITCDSKISRTLWRGKEKLATFSYVEELGKFQLASSVNEQDYPDVFIALDYLN